ncbi:hypothetical protein MJH12_03660 [bacterium]|nr:hypothetical protein [bacterium]
MNHSNEIIEYIINYFKRKPVLGIQRKLSEIEENILSKKQNKAKLGLYELALDHFKKHKQSNPAKEICTFLIQDDKSHLPAHILLASILVQERSFTLAQPKLNFLLVEAPDNKEVLQLQIDLNLKTKNKIASIEALQQFINVYPDSQDKRVLLAELLIDDQPLNAFEILVNDSHYNDANCLYHLSKLLYKIEMYDHAINFYNAYQKKETLLDRSKYLPSRILIERPEYIYRFYIDQKEIRSYSEAIELSPNQYHLEFENIHNQKFEELVTLKPGMDYSITFKPKLSILDTHFVKKSQYKLKFETLNEYRAIKKLLK